MTKPRTLWRPRLGFYMSVAAGLTYAGLSFFLGRFLSVPLLLFWFTIIVLIGALLVRLGSNITGGFIVASFAFLWWYFGNAGPYITFDGLMINLKSPLGIITTIAMLLGIAAGAVDIAEAMFTDSKTPH